MAYVTQTTGFIFLAGFGLFMLIISLFSQFRKSNSKESFLLANREVNWFFGGISIAASWIWAPALFVSVQLAYQKGLAGIFWFTVPNILALMLFVFLAPKIRKQFQEGFTLPQYIKHRFNNSLLHKVYLFPFFFYQIMAVTVQLYVGGSLISLLTGIEFFLIMPILAAITLTYTIIAGLRSSINTDFVQMVLIVGVGLVIIPMAISFAGGFSQIIPGFNGIELVSGMFDPAVAFSLGIVTSIGLFAGALSDQQYWQRTFAIKKNDLRKAFTFGALLFGCVPIGLSILGFLAANPNLAIQLSAGVDVSMIGVQTVAQLLPSWAMLLFVIALLAGLCSTLDSGLIAASSLWATDVTKSKSSILSTRLSMIGITCIGLVIAYLVELIPNFGLFHLWWVFNTVAATISVPTVCSLYLKRMSSKNVLSGILISFVLGLPIFIYGNVIGSDVIVVGTSVTILLVNLIFCLNSHSLANFQKALK